MNSVEIRKGDWIETFTGQQFYILDARLGEIDPRDPLHALCMLCRFGGHTKHFYSVAQHSLIVWQYLRDNGYGLYIQLLGLIHDFTEGYMVDLPRPIKGIFPEYGEAEDNLFNTILAALKIKEPTKHEWDIIKNADNTVLFHEANVLNMNKNKWAPEVTLLYGIEEELPSKVKVKFTDTFNKLYEQYNKEAS